MQKKRAVKKASSSQSKPFTAAKISVFYEEFGWWLWLCAEKQKTDLQ